MKKVGFIYLLISISSTSIISQDNFQKNLDEFLSEQPQEKIYLHLDKPYYGIGEDIWFKAYVTDGTDHNPLSIKSPLYVELISEEKEIVSSLTIPITDGTSHGSFKLGKNIEPGKYRIRAYTNWMRNFNQDFFFRKDISVVDQFPSIKDSSNLHDEENTGLLIDFMPEGGDLIDQLSTKVAIKTTDKMGNGIVVSGTIEDQYGAEITSFESNSFGHSLCFLKPTFETEYYAVLNGERYRLPQVKKEGAKIRIIHSSISNNINVAVISKEINLKGGTLVAHQRGKHLFSFQSDSKEDFAVKIDKNKIKAGICHFTFFDKNNLPLSERLIFINNFDDVSINIESDKKSYSEREKVVVSLESSAKEIHSASVTINSEDEIFYSSDEENIISYLLLSSDLRGKIQRPHYYFQDSKEAYNDLDLLMLTQGWSRFRWDELLENESYTPFFIRENGLTIRAQMLDYYNKNKTREGVFNVTIPKTGVLDLEGSTGPQGNFSVIGNLFYDSALVMISAHSFKGRNNKKDENVSIRLVDVPSPIITNAINSNDEAPQQYKNKVGKLIQITKAYHLDPEAILLDEVVVSSIREPKEDPLLKGKFSLYTQPSNRIILDSLFYGIGGAATVFDYMRVIPGVSVLGADNTVLIRGISSISGPIEPLFVLDGIPVEKEMIRYIPPQMIEFIDVLKGTNAALYGSRGSNGVVLIYTRAGSLNSTSSQKAYLQKESKGLAAFIYPGYDEVKQFYSPQYDTVRKEHAIPDYRSTLFWEPNLNFEDGKSQLDFYTSDQKGKFSIRIEGLLKNGKPFFKQSQIVVE